MKTAASAAPAGPRSDSERTALPESAQRQLEALRAAVDVRLAALDAVLADPSRGESLEALILDLARLSTEEAHAAATRACVGIKLEADTEIAQARKTAQQAIDHERIVSADFRRALEQTEQRQATLEREKQNDLRALREQFDSRLAQERVAGDQIERIAADLERKLADAQQRLEVEKSAGLALRTAVERSEASTEALRREQVQSHDQLTQTIDRLNGTVAAEQRRHADAERAHGETRAALAAERATTTELRAAAERLRAQSVSVEHAHEEQLAAQRTADAALAEERARVAEVRKAQLQIEATLEKERATTASLRDTISRTEALCAELERKRVEIQTKHDGANEYIEKERRLATELSRAKADAEAALDREHAITRELRGTTERLQKEVTRLSSDTAQHTAGQDELRDALLAARNETHRLRTELDAARADQGALDDVRGETRELRTSLDAERAASADLRRKVRDLESAIARSATESAQHVAGRDEVQQALSEARAHALQLEGDLATARSGAAELVTAKAALTTAKADAVARTKETETLRSSLEAERASAQTLAQRLEALEANLTAARQVGEEAVAATRVAEARAEEAATETKGRTADLEWLRTRNTELETQHATLDAAWHDAEGQLEKVTRERDQLVMQLEATRQSVAASPAERHTTATKPSKLESVKTEPKDASRARSAKAPAAELIPPPSSARVSSSDEAWSHVRLSTRYKFHEKIQIQVNNSEGMLADLSTGGCQLQSKTALKPKQAVKVTLPIDDRPLTCSGKVVWAHLEPPTKGHPLSYRAGVQFANADQAAIEAFLVSRGIKL